jgi:hypothetical protein
MNDEVEESGMWISHDKRPMDLTREQLKMLRAGLFESAVASASQMSISSPSTGTVQGN